MWLGRSTSCTLWPAPSPCPLPLRGRGIRSSGAAQLLHCCLDAPVENLGGPVQLLVARIERGNESDDAAVSADAEQQPAGQAVPGDGPARIEVGHLRFAVLDQLDPLNEPAAADVADDLVPRGQILELAPPVLANCLRALRQVVPDNDVEGRDRGI